MRTQPYVHAEPSAGLRAPTHSLKSVRALLDGVKACKADTSLRINVPGGFPITGQEFLSGVWQRGVTARCNRGLPVLSARGEAEYAAMQMDARRINGHYVGRERNAGCNGLLHSRKLKKRYPHIDVQPRCGDGFY